jgi:hypothetical protein
VKIHFPASVEILLLTVELVPMESLVFPTSIVKTLEFVKTFVILVSRLPPPVSVKVVALFKKNATPMRDVSTEIVFLFAQVAKQTMRVSTAFANLRQMMMLG